MNVLTMQDVRKSFGSLEVLKGISLTVGEGEAVSVIGPSGSGKSTLLRCATLLETMDGGSLAYGNDFAATMDAEGKSVYADKAALRRIKSRFGLVFQQFNLFPHYTVLKNVTDAPLIVQLSRSCNSCTISAIRFCCSSIWFIIVSIKGGF